MPEWIYEVFLNKKKHPFKGLVFAFEKDVAITCDYLRPSMTAKVKALTQNLEIELRKKLNPLPNGKVTVGFQ